MYVKIILNGIILLPNTMSRIFFRNCFVYLYFDYSFSFIRFSMDGNYSLIRSFILNNISDKIAIFDQLQPKERELLRRLTKNKDLSDFFKDTKTLYFFPEYRLHKILLLYVSPLLLVLGTFGNISSIFVMRQRSIIRMTAYVYLINLAIADSVVLYIGLLRLWISELTGMDIRNQTSWLCKLVVFCGYVSSDFSVWLIIAVTIERYIVVCHPRKVNNFCTVQRAKWVVCGLLLLFVAINIHFFWTISLNEKNVDNKVSYYCSSRKDFEYLVTVMWPWVDAFLYCFVPFGTILLLNILIIRRIVVLSRGTIKMQSAKSNLLQVSTIQINLSLSILFHSHVRVNIFMLTQQATLCRKY